MSDDTAATAASPETPAETDEADEQLKPALPSRARNPLTRDSDFGARPGFRNPANARTKAQKKGGKKKR